MNDNEKYKNELISLNSDMELNQNRDLNKNKHYKTIHSKSLTKEEKERLLSEKKHIIDKSLEEIQINFFRLGKALAEIKELKLYKADKLYKKWKEFVKYRIEPKLHQSTISDYIAIVKMQLANDDYIGEKDIIKIGYKKAKLLKTQYSKIMRIDNENEKDTQYKKFISFYKKNIESYQDKPYQLVKKEIDNVFNPNLKNNDSKEDNLNKDNSLIITLNEDENCILIKCENKSKLKSILKKLKSYYD